MAEDAKVKHPVSDHPVRLVVFDFDGTSIDGNSPVILVKYLRRCKLLRKRAFAKVIVWGIAYKLRLPQNETWVRTVVFSAFAGMSKPVVDQYLSDFYDESIAPLFRPQADETMRKHKEQGDVVIVVSASFEPIILRAMELHPFDYQISTRMRVDENGNYTNEVDGLPIEGAQKLCAVTDFANQTYGEGNWVLDSAYGDHHSDRPLLAAAIHTYAVAPDNPLERTAEREGWPILEW